VIKPSTSLPEEAADVTLLGVHYTHIKTRDGGDLYLTRYGVPFHEHLKPENWYEKEWFEQNREKLQGTSTVYRVKTREISGLGKDLVVKWCRVGETVPFDTFTFSKFVEAEFNSPYEEFSLVMEMRDQLEGGPTRTHRPLAIYVPAQKLKLWQTGRSMTKIERKKKKFRDVELDIYRQYILIYEWVKGISCVEAFMQMFPDMESRRKSMLELTTRGTDELARKGFRVLDMKPEHFIVRFQENGELLREHDGNIAYALVDFELLERTPEREKQFGAVRRAAYLKHQKNRFVAPYDVVYPEHLRPTRVLGVDYVYGHTESTQGWLWVVGRDPELFDYFLPERWRRTPRTKLSETNESYYTQSKDNIHLVWKVSRVGEQPDADTNDPSGKRVLEFGYNSPFEEVSLALELAARGVPTIYPRAIYMTGQEATPADYHYDNSRYQAHRDLRTPEGDPVLRPEHNYIIVWGYWNGLDELLASRDQFYCRGISIAGAQKEGLIGPGEGGMILQRAARDLAAAGFEDLNPKPSHVMLSVDLQGKLIRNDDGSAPFMLCNFSLLKRT